MTVYLIKQEETNEYKIGITEQTVSKRIKQLQTGSSEKLIEVCSFETKWNYKLEKILHSHFNKNKTRGEWFKLSLEEEKSFLTICQNWESKLNELERIKNIIL